MYTRWNTVLLLHLLFYDNVCRARDSALPIYYSYYSHWNRNYYVTTGIQLYIQNRMVLVLCHQWTKYHKTSVSFFFQTQVFLNTILKQLNSLWEGYGFKISILIKQGQLIKIKKNDNTKSTCIRLLHTSIIIIVYLTYYCIKYLH